MRRSGAPEWAQDRNRLWNEAERAETRKDARLAREIEVCLPHELTGEQRRWLVQDFVREQFVRKGYAVDVAIHAPDKGDARNYHAHILMRERRLEADGLRADERPRDEQAGAVGGVARAMGAPRQPPSWNGTATRSGSTIAA